MTDIWTPNPGSQTAFLADMSRPNPVREVLFGGAVGGGKTEALLMLPLYRAHFPEHRSIYLRRTKDRLREAIDRIRDLYVQVDPGGYWHETQMRWHWSTGAFTRFGSAEHETDIEQYKSEEFDLIIFDELTEWTEQQYKFMFTRNRSKHPSLSPIIRAATNPGGPGMAWVDRRFIGFKDDNETTYQPYEVHAEEIYIEGRENVVITRQWIPNTVFDNPQLPNLEAYLAGLGDLSPEEREAYLYGRWGYFRGQFFPKNIAEVQPGIRTDRGPSYIIRCMDYGWSEPLALYWLVVYPNLPKVEVAAELYATKLTLDDIVHLAHDIERNQLRIEPRKVAYSVLSPDACDRSTFQGGKTIQAQLAERGLWFSRANNDRISGWATLLQLISTDELVAWRGQAPNLLRTLPKLPRDDNDGRDVKRRGVEDHAAEALRYGVMAYHEGKASPPEEPKRTRPSDRDWLLPQLLAELRAGGDGFPPGF